MYYFFTHSFEFFFQISHFYLFFWEENFSVFQLFLLNYFRSLIIGRFFAVFSLRSIFFRSFRRKWKKIFAILYFFRFVYPIGNFRGFLTKMQFSMENGMVALKHSFFKRAEREQSVYLRHMDKSNLLLVYSNRNLTTAILNILTNAGDPSLSDNKCFFFQITTF